MQSQISFSGEKPDFESLVKEYVVKKAMLLLVTMMVLVMPVLAQQDPPLGGIDPLIDRNDNFRLYNGSAFDIEFNFGQWYALSRGETFNVNVGRGYGNRICNGERFGIDIRWWDAGAQHGTRQGINCSQESLGDTPPPSSPPSNPPQNTGGTTGLAQVGECITPISGPVNVRNGASTSNARVGTLSVGDTVTVLEVVSDWYRIGVGEYVSSTVTMRADCANTQPSTNTNTGNSTSGSCLSVMNVNGLNIVTNDLPRQFTPEMLGRVWNYMSSATPRLRPYGGSPYIWFTWNQSEAEAVYDASGFAGMIGRAAWDGCRFQQGGGITLITVLRGQGAVAWSFGVTTHEMCHYWGGIHGAEAPADQQTDGFETTSGAGDCYHWFGYGDNDADVATRAWLGTCRNGPLCEGLRVAVLG